MFHQTFNDKKLKNIKSKVTKMIDNIKYSFKKLINEKEWIDKKTKHYAFKKLNSMRSLFYDMKNYTLKEMETLYDHLRFTNESTFEEAKESLKTFDVLLTKKKKLLNKLSLTSLFQPNAAYKLTENRISYNLGIFMKPYFDEKLPMSFNYGGLGYIIGHEITHGFDDDGSQYSEDGKKFNWWSDEEKKIFQEKSNRFIEQYNKNVEKVSGYNVNGTLTLSENIADNGGVKAAFNAYRKYLNELGRDELKIPGYEKYSNEQLFFIAYSQLYCSSFTFASTYYLMMNDPHSPDRFRVLTTLGNQKSFSDAFKCKVGSKMNPKDKVVIWKTGK
uniref:Peptidase_M13 domain-containing protein n=1 Tax=Strongyloides papillosus TaxID=174720 RepID=A0A0N5BSZ2_STREA